MTDRLNTTAPTVNYHGLGFEAFYKGERCPPGATASDEAAWQRGWELAVRKSLKESFGSQEGN
jgi:hypothetical protein